MEQARKGRKMFGVRVKEEDFFNGEQTIWLEFKYIYDVYQRDALDVSLIACWVLMEIQRCRREQIFYVGFMDPAKINADMILTDLEGTYENLFKFVDKQNYMDSILLPYNFGFHWILIVLSPDRGVVNVFDSLNKPQKLYQDIIEMFTRMWNEIHAKHPGFVYEKLVWHSEFPCMR
ncbi:unnamed protein product [Urochloa humidicola]